MIRVDASGVDRLSHDVSRLAATVHDTGPILKLLGLLGVRAVQRNFDAATSPDGTPFKALAASTLRQRRGSSGTKPLSDTRVMRNGISFDLPRPGSVRIAASALTRSRNAIHNFGGQAGRGLKTTIPQRQYMGFTDAARAEMVDLVRAQVLRILRSGL